MRIAEVAPLYESVPPRFYGGTERVVSYLTEELVDMGHEVTLFASGDSVTRAELVAVCPESLRLSGMCANHVAWHLIELERVFARAAEFDVIHFHVDYLHFPLTRREPSANTVTTLHGRLDLPELVPIYMEFPDIPVISISNRQRQPLPHANWRGTVHHGLPPESFKFGDGSGGYLAFLGRVSPEKRVDRAIEIAIASQMPLKIAAKIDAADRDYFESKIKPMLDHPLVEFVGEIGDADKNAFLGDAYALLFPIDWPEPFGLVMVESFACGTPVIAYDHGSVPEVMEQGRTGYVVASIPEAVEAVRKLKDLNRRECRAVFDERFTARRMATEYVDLYRHTLTPELV